MIADKRKTKGGWRRLALTAAIRLAVAAILMSGLSACAIPPVISIASLAADGVLLATTGKSKADHGLSLVTGQDCSTFRVFEDQNVCQDDVIAQAEPMPAEVERELARLRSPSMPQGLTPRVALAATFQGQSAATGLKLASLPRLISSDEVAVAQDRHVEPVVQVAHTASPSRYKMALAEQPKAAPVVKASLEKKSVRTVKVAKAAGPHKKVAKSVERGKKIAKATPQRKLKVKAAKHPASTVKAAKVESKSAVKKVASKKRPLPPVASKPASRKVSSLAPAKVRASSSGATASVDADEHYWSDRFSDFVIAALQVDDLLSLAKRQ